MGLLTLGWTPSSYQETINQIKKQIVGVKQKGIRLDKAWTQGHSDIAGNEIAERLAKEVAQEAENMDEAEDRVVTIADIKAAVKQHV